MAISIGCVADVITFIGGSVGAVEETIIRYESAAVLIDMVLASFPGSPSKRAWE